MDVQSIILRIPSLVKLHFTILGSIHTSDLFALNYCVNILVHAIMKNGYTTHY